MFTNDPYRHSVWFDIFGILLFAAVLLGGAAYLLVHVERSGSTIAANASQGTSELRGHDRSSARFHSAPGRRGLTRSSPRTGPSVGSPLRPPPSSAAPFAKSWREKATPDLSGPSSSSGNGTEVFGGEGASSFGPALASRRPDGGSRSGSVQRSGDGETAGSGWRAEARTFAGRARALSNQLGQMSGRSKTGKGGEASSSREAPARVSSSASSPPDTPSNPEQVPIGGVGWLAAAGAAYALRRLSA